MIEISLTALAACCGGSLRGDDQIIRGVCTDTRTTSLSHDNVLFVALRGSHFDGHTFLESARSRGWRAALISDESACVPGLSYVVVPDVLLALQTVAHWWRMQCRDLVVIVVAGSNGKTTTKEMIRSILSVSAPVWATKMNQNNHIGVPLTLLGLSRDHRYAIVEVGMNHPGEMAPLLAMIAPQYAVVTNTLREHMGYLKSQAAIADENGEAYRCLPVTGTAVLNASDAFYHCYQKDAQHCHCYTYAYTAVSIPVDLPASLTPEQAGFRIAVGAVSWNMPIPGRHFAYNAVAAIAVCRAVGVSDEHIRTGLMRFTPVAGRQKRHIGRGGVHVIDDGYNANPDSVSMAIAVLAETPHTRMLVLGDMREMGEFAEAYHAEIGERARMAGIEYFFAYGDDMRYAVAAFGDGGKFFETQEALIDYLAPYCRPDVTMLVKGSAVMNMPRVLSFLLATDCSDIYHA